MNGADAAFALLLGAVAAFNPCGFALLPSYIALTVTGTATDDQGRLAHVRRALAFGAAMTAGFVAVFSVFGLLAVGVSSAIQATVLPVASYVTLVLGVGIVVVGVLLLAGREVSLPGFPMFGSGSSPVKGAWSQVGYGAVFALASLSCTVGPFLAVVARALVAGNPVGALAPFVIYAAGMGAAVITLALASALFGDGVGRMARRSAHLLPRIGGAVMVISGLAAVIYGLAEVLPQWGIDALNPVLLGSGRWQGSVTTAIQGWGPWVWVAIVAAVAALAVGVVLGTRRRAG